MRFQKFSLLLHPLNNNDGAIAQLVEQRTENPCVPGSIPGGTTDKERVTKVTLFYFIAVFRVFGGSREKLGGSELNVLSSRV